MGTHLRVISELSNEYQHDRWFSKALEELYKVIYVSSIDPVNIRQEELQA